jgi:hypothetical protein
MLVSLISTPVSWIPSTSASGLVSRWSPVWVLREDRDHATWDVCRSEHLPFTRRRGDAGQRGRNLAAARHEELKQASLYHLPGRRPLRMRRGRCHAMPRDATRRPPERVRRRLCNRPLATNARWAIGVAGHFAVGRVGRIAAPPRAVSKRSPKIRHPDSATEWYPAVNADPLAGTA